MFKISKKKINFAPIMYFIRMLQCLFSVAESFC